MFVGERMTHPVITVTPETPINDALQLMRDHKIRRIVVVEHDRPVGIVSHGDLLNASPSPATSLSVWELNYLLSKITVGQIMTHSVVTVTPQTPLETAARLMADNRIGGLPVVEHDKIVGIITETDLFRIFLELLGARAAGVRATVVLKNEPGALARITGPIAAEGGNIMALGTFAAEDAEHMEVVIKIADMTVERARSLLTPLADRVVDIH